MSSYRQILYHLIIHTKNNRSVLNLEYSNELYAYIMGYIKNKNCKLYRINGVENHLHILCDLHPSLALADFMRDMKTSSSVWLKKDFKFRSFQGWSDGYGALTYAYKDKELIINYIKKQREHHLKESFEDEYRRLLDEFGIIIDERFFP